MNPGQSLRNRTNRRQQRKQSLASEPVRHSNSVPSATSCPNLLQPELAVTSKREQKHTCQPTPIRARSASWPPPSSGSPASLRRTLRPQKFAVPFEGGTSLQPRYKDLRQIPTANRHRHDGGPILTGSVPGHDRRWQTSSVLLRLCEKPLRTAANCGTDARRDAPATNN